jgi:hypothetical protein
MKLTLDNVYMSESYDQFRNYGSKRLLIERLIGILFIMAGIGFLTYTTGKTFLPALLILFGIFELCSNAITKYFWLRRHKKSKLFNAEVEINISESGIESISPFSNGSFSWSGIEKIVRTPEGILVWPQKGMYWYFPEKIFGKETIHLIESKISN